MDKNRKLATVATFAALIIVLQCISTFINFGSFPITLTLIPIIVGAAVFGPFIGLLLGSVFGIVVAIMVVTGADPSGATMLAVHPVITICTCIIKGALAGLVSGLVYRALKDRNENLAIVLAAAAAPLTNTITLFLVLIIYFESSFAVMVSALMSINFIIELMTNILLAPGLLNLIHKWQIKS